MKLKNSYFDLRLGALTLNPVIQFSNFLMLAYLVIENYIPFWIFAPLFIVGIIGLYSFVGNKFRNIQYETDSNLIYEKQTEQARTNLEIMNQIKAISLNTETPLSVAFEKRRQYLKEIADSKL